MKTLLASLFAASLLVATAPAADANVGVVVHVGGGHHRHHMCGGWGWRNHHREHFCRRWYWR